MAEIRRTLMELDLGYANADFTQWIKQWRERRIDNQIAKAGGIVSSPFLNEKRGVSKYAECKNDHLCGPSRE